VTYQDSYHGIVVGIVCIIRELFYDLKEMPYESVIDVDCNVEGSDSAQGGVQHQFCARLGTKDFDLLRSLIFTLCILDISYKSSINSRCSPGSASLFGLAIRSTRRVKAPSLFMSSKVTPLSFASERRKAAAIRRTSGSSS
jgi:hypothetical protein